MPARAEKSVERMALRFSVLWLDSFPLWGKVGMGAVATVQDRPMANTFACMPPSQPSPSGGRSKSRGQPLPIA
jgi:hypothetical protein